MNEKQLDALRTHIAAILGSAHHADGMAILPGYLLEQLADKAGLKLNPRNGITQNPHSMAV